MSAASGYLMGAANSPSASMSDRNRCWEKADKEERAFIYPKRTAKRCTDRSLKDAQPYAVI
jgi:hypothetical protein